MIIVREATGQDVPAGSGLAIEDLDDIAVAECLGAEHRQCRHLRGRRSDERGAEQQTGRDYRLHDKHLLRGKA